MLIGHQRVWNFLIKSAQKNRLAHAYLLTGPAEVGKKTLALEFAQWLLCSDKKDDRPCGVCRNCQDISQGRHPDVFLLAPRQEEKKGVLKTYEIGIEEIRDFIHHLCLSPYCADFKIAIVDEADWLSREAVNAFLKTLEEPSSQTLIFLITSDFKAILPTIVSRCQTLNFLPVPQKEIEEAVKNKIKDNAVWKKSLRLCAGRPGRLLKILRQPELLEEQAEQAALLRKILKADILGRFEWAKEAVKNAPALQEILANWLLWLRDQILISNGGGEFSLEENPSRLNQSGRELARTMREIQRSRALIQNPGLDSRLVLENLMLKI